MTLFQRILGRERRKNTISASNPCLAEFFNQRGVLGDSVDATRASGLAVAQACIAIISQSLAGVPLCLYVRAANGGREKAASHPLYGVLHDTPNPSQTAFEVREYLTASLMITGNAYARLVWNGRGQVVELYPLDPSKVGVEYLEGGRLRYRVTHQNGGVDVYLQEEILHLRYRLARDGVMGLSPIQLAREIFHLALTQQETANKQATKAFRPEGALVFPQKLSQEKADQFHTFLKGRYESNHPADKIMILDSDIKWQAFAFSSKDAEFLESRKLTNLDICRVFGVPPTVAGITDNATYSNTDQESRALVVRCLAPMAKRIEQAMNAALLPLESRKRFFIEHDMAGLLRGDLKARYEAYRIGREWGWLSINEIRGWENMPQVEGGDERLSPLNMTPLNERSNPKAEVTTNG